jgi:small subunit ribosomal protein S1
MTIKKDESIVDDSKMGKLLGGDQSFTDLPGPGDIVKGTIISAEKKEVLLDINGIMTGIVRGKELFNESSEFSDLQAGDETEATVMTLENELGMVELSFRYAGHQRTWAKLEELQTSSETIVAKVTDANKGGLLVIVNGVSGFLPVSQLSPEYYPRIQGGDKNKILEKLKSHVKKEFPVKVLDVNEQQEKLIVSEKAAWEEEQKDLFSKYNVGDKVDGTITAVTDFGVFIQFGENLEGLVHISELAWQRIEDPKALYKVGDKIKAEIINIDGSKIFLSSKKLKADPWEGVEDKYKVSDVVEGKILKVTPFGFFVELDNDIHGLAHISEMKDPKNTNLEKLGKEGEVKSFKIVSIEAKEHRLGLSFVEGAKGESVKEKDDLQDASGPSESEDSEPEVKAEEVKEEEKEEETKE